MVGDQKKIVGDLKPFSVKESYYAAAKSFVDSEEATSTSTSQSSKKKKESKEEEERSHTYPI